MAQKSITQILLDKYQLENYETSNKITIEDAKTINGYECYFYDELHKTEVSGFPVASDFVDPNGNVYDMNTFPTLPKEIQKTCRLRYHYLPKTHELYIGTTGSGKTTGCVEPQLRAVASQKNKPNLFVTDPKGELYNHNALFLEKNGYKTFILNFKNLNKTDRWNPLIEIYESYMRLRDINAPGELKPGKPGKGVDLRYYAGTHSTYYLQNNIAFDTIEEFENYQIQQTDLISSETDSLIRQLSTTICPVKSTKDPTWEQGAQQAIEGVILAMLEDALYEEETGFTKNMFTLKTLLDYMNALRVLILNNGERLTNVSFLKNKKKAIEKLGTAYSNAGNTMKSYVGVLDSCVTAWRQGHILSLTTGNTIDIDNLDQPFAIFVITRDYEKSDFQIAGLFIDFIYRKLIKKAESNINFGNKETRATHFLLDEFGNIPRIENFDNKIATSRSRNIWMHLFLQSYEQLDNVYMADANNFNQAPIIISNCNSQIFLGSQSFPSIQRFSNECGKRSVRMYNDFLKTSYTFVEVPVLKVTDLNLIEPGAMYNKRLFTPVMYSHYIRSYILSKYGYYKDFTYDSLETVPKNNFQGYTGPEYTYEPVVNFDKDEESDPWD